MVRRNVGAEGDDGRRQSGLFHQPDYAHLNEALNRCCEHAILDKRRRELMMQLFTSRVRRSLPHKCTGVAEKK